MSQQSKTTLQSAINTQIADNTSGDISAADIRDNLINITDSLLFNTGSGQAITGSLIVTEGITGSLQGTATTASYVQTAQTASFLNVGTYSITSSWAVSASQALTASRATSASYALSASWAPSVASNPFPFTGSAIISGSLGISGSLTLPTIPDVSTGYINMLSYGGIRIRDNDFYEMKLTVDNPSGNSSAVSPGFMVMSGVGGYGINTIVASSTLGETESTINFYGPANSRIQSSQQLILSGSSVNIGRLMTLQPLNPLPSVTNGSIAYSSSGDFYFGSGSAWRKLTL